MSALKNKTEQTVLLVQKLKTLGSIFCFTVVVKSLSVSVSYKVLSESCYALTGELHYPNIKFWLPGITKYIYLNIKV